MKTVKNYDNFSEEYRLNENLLTRAWAKVVNFFKEKYKKNAWVIYMNFLKKTNKMPAEYDFFDPQSEEIPSEDDVTLAIESISVKYNSEMNEAVVDLKSDTLENIDAVQLQQVVKKIYNKNKRRVEKGIKRSMNDAVFIWGAPGIGKTSILKQVVKELDIKMVTWHLASTDPTDFRGVPTIESIVTGSKDPKDFRTVTKLPAVFPSNDCENGKGGILFFDELNQAPQMILSAALPIILEGELGEYSLPDMWIVVAAGNRQEDLGGGGTTFEAPLSNRFAHYNYAPDLITDFFPYIAKNPEMNPDLIPFLKFKPKYFHSLDTEKDVLGWPSPRAWELASSDEYFQRDESWNSRPLSDKDFMLCYAPRVGSEAANAFRAFLELKKFFNADDVQNVFEKGVARAMPIQLDQMWAASLSIAGYKKGEKLTEKELSNFFKYVSNMLTDKKTKDGLEVATSLVAWINFIHTEIKADDKLKKIYFDFIKIWHNEMKDIENKIQQLK